MANNYASRLPLDEAGNLMQEFPSPVPALAATAAVTAVSSILILNNKTTSIEVAAPNVGVALKWITTTNTNPSVIATGATNFDHVIPAGTYRRFVIPRETQGIAGPALPNSVHGLYQRLATIPLTAAVSSVLLTEYGHA